MVSTLTATVLVFTARHVILTVYVVPQLVLEMVYVKYVRVAFI